jgi:protein-disulfide isomerase
MAISPNDRPRGSRAFLVLAILLLLGGAGFGWWYASRDNGVAEEGSGALEKDLASAGIDGRERAAIEGLVRAYILDHPEIIPEAVERLQQKEVAAQLGPIRGALETPFPGAVLGNPQGKITLVEFTDFACGYCRKSVADVEALIAANPDLKVVVRELPIISAESGPAAKMALAAAAQGKFPAFHKAMFSGAQPGAGSIAAAAGAAGLDLAAANAFVSRPDGEQELARNLELAKRLGISGTPAWVIGDQLISGAVGKERLAEAIAAARKGG